ncbi:uncharacterized protein BT62DRAFT_920669 [Guyanagaster necrorhizus]|uniref:Uncharacterized protein n=1 Tax=Guyanagaster necrorhizus TaxID=856835 RepID=A0A9P7VRF4_9AGAR|nr:uncharacterized protein BT62DRAFT_920669 [Guyanagaster necrorhizus MCA 3950]KAG7445457.1 hypothetical protein BT62DRAFT_920669 [Guyanagaster necrorhizus MCA 3950]
MPPSSLSIRCSRPSLDGFKARVIACNKGKGCAIYHSYATIDAKSDEDEDDPDKVEVSSDSDTESIKMIIDEKAFRAGRSLKFSNARSSNVVTEDKHKKLYKPRSIFIMVLVGLESSTLPQLWDLLVSVFADEERAAPSVDALHESYKESTIACFVVERSEHLAKLKSVLMGDVLMLQHTLYAAEKQHMFLLDELECIQSTLHLLVPVPSDSGDPTPVETEAPPAPFTSSNVKPSSA